MSFVARLFLWGAILAGLLPVAGSPARAQATCTEVSIPVSLNTGVTVGPIVLNPVLQNARIAGALCVPPGARTLQVLVPGATYNRSYWSSDFGAGAYSYARHANQRGYATLAIDRLGMGRSTRPLSALITYDSHVSSVNQVIAAARSGALGHGFDRIVLVGHSLGSVIAYGSAGSSGQVDALVITGGSHLMNYPNLALLFTNLQPAFLEPRFAGADPGYLTTIPGRRGAFYNVQNADPAMIAADEQTKDIESSAGIGPALLYNNVDTRSQNINIPVLTVNGSADPYFCRTLVTGLGADCSSSEALSRGEQPFFGPGAVVWGYVVPNAGHDLNLELNREVAWYGIDWFLEHLFGSAGSGTP